MKLYLTQESEELIRLKPLYGHEVGPESSLEVVVVIVSIVDEKEVVTGLSSAEVVDVSELSVVVV